MDLGLWGGPNHPFWVPFETHFLGVLGHNVGSVVVREDFITQ